MIARVLQRALKQSLALCCCCTKSLGGKIKSCCAMKQGERKIGHYDFDFLFLFEVMIVQMTLSAFYFSFCKKKKEKKQQIISDLFAIYFHIYSVSITLMRELY
jgi:hypothetical protein